MIGEIIAIQTWLMDKTNKQSISELNVDECLGVHIIPLNSKDFLVEIKNDGAISILGPHLEMNMN